MLVQCQSILKNFIYFFAAFACFNVHADIHISPWLGYTFGGKVENQESTEFDLKPSVSYAISVEADLDKGRIGLFYAQQNTSVETINVDSAIHYLHFQSSIYYPVQEKLNTYIGVGVGGSYIDADWVEDKYGFSASIFGGIEYDIAENVSINGQLRWLGTVVDNETSGACNLPSSSSSQCIVRFNTDWMNQFSTNIGLTFSF